MLKRTLLLALLLAPFSTFGQFGSYGVEFLAQISDALSPIMRLDPNDNMYLKGRFRDSVNIGNEDFTLPNDGFFDNFIAKFSPEGELIWFKSFDSRLNGRNFSINEIATMEDKVFLTGVFRDSLVFEGAARSGTNTDNVFILSMDGSGNLNWLKTYISDSSLDGGFDIETFEDFVYVNGSFSGAEFEGLPFEPGFFIAKYTTDGEMVWLQDFEEVKAEVNTSTGSVPRHGLTIDSQGNLILVTDFDDGVDKYRVFKIDSSGTPFWDIASLGGHQYREVHVNDAHEVFVYTREPLLPFIAKFTPPINRVIGRYEYGVGRESTEFQAATIHNDHSFIMPSFYLFEQDSMEIFNRIILLEIDRDGAVVEFTPIFPLIFSPYQFTAYDMEFNQSDQLMIAGQGTESPTLGDTTYIVNDWSIFLSRLTNCKDINTELNLEDQVLCQNSTITLSVGEEFSSAVWSTGERSLSIEVNQPGEYWVTATLKNGCQTSDTVNITEELCTGLPELAADNLKIFPNPNNGSFTLEIPRGLQVQFLSVSDLSGRKIWSSENALYQGTQLTTPLNPGIYLLKVATAQRIYQMKLIVDGN